MILASFPIGDAVDFIFHERESVAGGTKIGGAELWPLVGNHIAVTVASLAIACVLAIPIALWVGHRGRGQVAASLLANGGRAVPSYALVVFTSAFIGADFNNLMLAMVVLAVPPIFINTYVGINQVDRDVIDAARGMGMTGPQIVRRIEVPLALPLIFGGIRTSSVNVIATATLGPLVGVQTLGDAIINPNVYGPAGQLGGSILVVLLALASEALFAGIQRAVTPAGLKRPPTQRNRSLMRTRTITSALLALAAMLVLAACGSDNNSSTDTSAASTGTSTQARGYGDKTIQPVDGAASTPAITVGSKNFTEEFILGNIYAQALQAAGYKVKTQFNLGSEQIALKALKANKIGMYPEYTGTVVTSFCGVKPENESHDADQAYQQAKDCMAKQSITALPQTPYTNSNGFAVTQATAKKLGVSTLSDLKGKSQNLVVSGGPECRQRPDCLVGLEKTYGLKFKKFLSIDLAKRHEVIVNGQSDVGLVFTTDGQIAADKLVVLKDDKHLFPPYNATLLVRDDVAKSHPGMEKVVEQIQGGLTDAVMQELNSRVDLDKQKPEDVARQYLTESGYLAK